MQLGFKLFHFFVLVAWCAQPCIAEKLYGTVRSNDGTPLADVAIYVGSDLPKTKTTADGSFVVEITWKGAVIFVAHPGFRPAARPIQSFRERMDIVIEPESLSTWWLPTCLSKPPASRVFGGVPSLPLPKGVKFRTGSTDIDYRVDRIAFGSWWHPQYLEFWIGPSAAGPRPPDYLFKQSKEFSLRYWRSKDMSREGIDARGSDSDGRRWRHVNIGSNGIMYRQASDAAAKFFDGIVDSMCMPTATK
jgi:hypothetical protein